MRLAQQLFDCGRPPQAGRSGRGQQQHQPGLVARAIEIVLKLVDVTLCQRCECGLTGWRCFRQPEIPDDQERSTDPDQPKHVFDSSRLHVLPGKQACYDLWEKDHKKDDQSSTPEQGDAQRASLSALSAPNVYLNETDAEQDGCADKEPRT
jgi:hypothetical protein